VLKVTPKLAHRIGAKPLVVTDDAYAISDMEDDGSSSYDSRISNPNSAMFPMSLLSQEQLYLRIELSWLESKGWHRRQRYL
jgi:hypothetical protein